MTSSRRIPLRAFPLVAIAIPLALLAGCASTSSNTGGGAPASAGSESSKVAAASSKASAEAAGTGGSTGTGLCALVSLDQAKAAVQVPTLTRQVTDTGLDGEPVCGYTSADGATYGLRVDEEDLAKEPFTMAGNFDGAALTAVDGLGEKAGVNKDELDVAVHGKLLVVMTFGSKDVGQNGLVALGKLFVAKL